MKVIYQGVLYTFQAAKENDSRPDHWKGFGGRHFTVVMNTGETVLTDDLFMQYGQKEGQIDTGKIYQGWDMPMPEKLMGWAQVRGDNTQCFSVIGDRNEQRG